VTTTSPDDHKRAVQQLWDELYARDFDAVGAHFLDDGEYTDVPSPDDDVARGPAEIAARLRLGLEPLDRLHHDIRLMVAEDDSVVTEHVEHWHWSSGEHVSLPFVSVHVFRDGRIARWWDYWDMQTLMGPAPGWWVEHVMQGYK
jgi:ketosteroid isomerase-like protein